MFVKQVSIQGFKSYREQTEIEEFSPRHNAVVGRNGSGKSNFFAAIRFVLSDAYANMGREERQALLHEGAGPSNVNAFVEIVFDNSDNRFPTGKDEVILRRTIGLKKDEYQLDKKSVPKSEIMSLLESAGFSRSNPYYIVPQGRITSLCNARDEDRLKLLKDVAGTRVYEQRRRESLKIMEETDAKRSKIEELLGYIEERLQELQEEKEELRNFYSLDKSRRSLEYSIYQREYKAVGEELELIEESRSGETLEHKMRLARIVDRDQLLSELNNEIQELKYQQDALKVERQRLLDDLEEQTRVQKVAELELAEVASKSNCGIVESRKLEAHALALDDEVQKKTMALKSVRDSLEDAKAEEELVRVKYQDLDSKRQMLIEKKARCALFKTKNDRENSIGLEISALEEKIEKKQTLITALMGEISQRENNILMLEKEVSHLNTRVNEDQEIAVVHRQKIEILNSQREDFLSKRKELWRIASQTDGKVSHLRESGRALQRKLASSVNASIFQGLEGAMKLASRMKLPGVHGPVFQLFQVDDIYATAVDVAAGNSLFHLVVDSDEIASQLLTAINREKLGRVTFMPLNQLKPSRDASLSVDGVFPVLSKLKFAEKFTAVFLHIFGKSVICDSIKTAKLVAKANGINAITLEGDVVERKGAIVGGYHDGRSKRIVIAQKMLMLQREIDELSLQQAAGSEETIQIESSLKAIQSESADIERDRRRIIEECALTRNHISSLSARIDNETEIIQLSRLKIDRLSQDVEQEQQHKAKLIEELKSPFQMGFSNVDSAALSSAIRDLHSLQASLADCSSNRSLLEEQCNELHSEINNSLIPQRMRIQEKLAHSDDDKPNDVIDSDHLKATLRNAEQNLAHISGKILEIDHAIEEGLFRASDLQSSFEKAKSEQIVDRRASESEQKYVERFLSKQSLLLKKREECAQKIKDLGSLPDEAYDDISQAPTKKLIKELHKTHNKLKAYNHVNKKAFEQFNNFTKQRDSLLGRKQELDFSAKVSQGSVACCVAYRRNQGNRRFNRNA
eukprot:Partr_v1_DN28934_c1_g1_i6_m25464 putative Chromosome segregation protein